MTAHIPAHDGRTPDALRLSFSGSDDASDEVLHVGDAVAFVVLGKVTAVAYRENQFGVLRRVQSVAVDHAIPAPETVRKQIESEARRREAEGQEELDLDD